MLEKTKLYKFSNPNWECTSVLIDIDYVNEMYYFLDITHNFKHKDEYMFSETNARWHRKFENMDDIHAEVIGDIQSHPEYFL